MRRFAAKLLLASGAVLATLLALEGALRAVGSYWPNPPLYPGERSAIHDATVDPLIGWHLPPGRSVTETKEEYSVTYKANPQGFRSPHDFAADSGAPRIALLGDSYAFGSGVAYEETFAARLERATGIEVLDYGMGGFGIDQMWLTLGHYALSQGADLVIVAFISSDLDRSLSAYRRGHAWLAKPAFRLDDEGRLRPLAAEDRPSGIPGLIRERSHLAELVRRTDRSLTRWFPFTRTWKLNRALFATMVATCREASVPLVAVYLPNNRRHSFPLLAREFAAMEIPFLDLTPLLPRDAASLYYPLDHHFTAAGHAFAAGAILDFLVAHHLLPEPAPR